MSPFSLFKKKGRQALPLKRMAKLSSIRAVFLQSPARLTLMLIMLGGASLVVKEEGQYLSVSGNHPQPQHSPL